MKTFFTLLATLLLAGCATTLTPQQEAALEYGERPENAEATARAWFNRTLKDPYTAHYSFKEVEQGWMRDAPIMGGKIHGGWRIMADVNAKNSYGGYTGVQQYIFFFENTKLTRVFHPQGYWSKL